MYSTRKLSATSLGLQRTSDTSSIHSYSGIENVKEVELYVSITPYL